VGENSPLFIFKMKKFLAVEKKTGNMALYVIKRNNCLLQRIIGNNKNWASNFNIKKLKEKNFREKSEIDIIKNETQITALLL
jgi:hypothetical protein